MELVDRDVPLQALTAARQSAAGEGCFTLLYGEAGTPTSNSQNREPTVSLNFWRWVVALAILTGSLNSQGYHHGYTDCHRHANGRP